jgi:hypothetical protein
MVAKFRGSNRQRVFSLGFLDGTGTGIQIAVVGVVIAERFGLAAAGLVLGVSSLGRFGSPLVFWAMDRHPGVGSGEMHRLFRWAVVGMTVTSLGVVGSAVWLAPWVTVAVGLVWALCNSVSTIIATTAVPDSIHGYGPVTIVGTAVGAWVGAAAIADGVDGGVGGVAAVAVAVLLLLQLAEVPLIASVTFRSVTQVSPLETVRHAGKGFAVAVLTYGPVVVYQALTLTIASVEWVGWAMAAYAAGALLAIPVSRRLAGFHTFGGLLLLGAVGVGVWAVALNGPLLLATRFVSGLVLFIAQGRLISIAYGDDGKASTARLAGSSTGLGIGASVGAVIAARLAADYSVSVMAFALTAATLAAAAAVAVVKLRGRTAEPVAATR